jgi:hypothetical protein
MTRSRDVANIDGILTAKGDIYAATAAATPDRLEVGANNTVLTADSSTATGLKWAAVAAGGKVLQVVMGTTSTTTTTTSSTYADTTLTASITPSSSSSKVLVLVAQNGCGKTSGNVANAMQLRLVRGATEIAMFADQFPLTQTTLRISGLHAGISYLDEPATTSATTYKTQFKSVNASTLLVVQEHNDLSSIILLEIGA